MSRRDNQTTPISQRDYRAKIINPQFSPSIYDTLRLRALHHNATPDGYIKHILNNQINRHTLPNIEAFNRHYPATKTHQANAVTLASSFPPIYLRYLDSLIETLPAVYEMQGRSRRRMVETLTLIDLFN